MNIKAALLLLVASCVVPVANAADVSRFFGYYEGAAVTFSDDGIKVQRELSVELRGYGSNGFTVSWSTATIRPDSTDKVSENSINFEPDAREGVYGSAMRRNLFGEQKPLDPLKGEPYVWATVAGDTLTVHSLTITEDGGYEMQSYVRRLVEGGLDLKFQRVHNGERLRSIETLLRRATHPNNR